MKKKRIFYLILLILGVALFYGVANSFLQEGELFLQVDQLKSNEWGENRLQVMGKVAQGSLASDPNAQVRFVLEGEQVRLSVHYEGALPAAFEEGKEAVVSGQLHDGLFEATEVVAKCPSKYR